MDEQTAMHLPSELLPSNKKGLTPSHSNTNESQKHSAEQNSEHRSTFCMMTFIWGWGGDWLEGTFWDDEMVRVVVIWGYKFVKTY